LSPLLFRIKKQYSKDSKINTAYGGLKMFYLKKKDLELKEKYTSVKFLIIIKVLREKRTLIKL